MIVSELNLIVLCAYCTIFSLSSNYLLVILYKNRLFVKSPRFVYNDPKGGEIVEGAEPKRRGRKSSDNIVETEKWAMNLGVVLKKRLEKYGAEHGLDQSGIVRMALDLFLTERGY